MLFWRFFIAGIWISFFVIKDFDKNKFKQTHFRSLLYMFFLGAIFYACASELYFIASPYIGTGLAMVIFFSYPILVALISWILKENHFNLVSIFMLAFMCGGLFLLQDNSNNKFDIAGISLALLSSLGYALYVIGSKKISSLTIDTKLLTTAVCFGCAFIFLIISLFTHTLAFPHTLKNCLLLLAFGILSTAIPIQLMLIGLRYISSIRASIISVLEPLVTLLVGIALLHESISHMQLLGAFIILASALFVQFQKDL